MEIKVPEDFVSGTECLQNEVPWQVPESIYVEAIHLRDTDVVLEVGTGGSTLFFARRCKKVIALETSPEWTLQVRKKLSDERIGNVLYAHMQDAADACDFIRKMDTSDVTVFSVDTDGAYDRSQILNTFLHKGISKSLRMLVLDNYSHPQLFPLHHDKLVIDSPHWQVYTFNHERWAGDGTRLYIKNADHEST